MFKDCVKMKGLNSLQGDMNWTVRELKQLLRSGIFLKENCIKKDKGLSPLH